MILRDAEFEYNEITSSQSNIFDLSNCHIFYRQIYFGFTCENIKTKKLNHFTFF